VWQREKTIENRKGISLNFPSLGDRVAQEEKISEVEQPRLNSSKLRGPGQIRTRVEKAQKREQFSQCADNSPFNVKARMLIRRSIEQCCHKIEHLAGKPQGPSLSFVSGSSLVPFVFVFGVAWVFCCFVVLSPFCATAAASDFEEPSSQNETLETCLPKVSPWIVASSSSRAVGWRDPSAPYEC